MGCFTLEAFRPSFTTIRSLMKFYTLFIVVGLSACQGSNDKLKEFEILKGSWEATDPAGKFVESWTVVNDTLMTGNSFMTQHGDTVFTEKLQLTFQNDSVYYFPTVTGQNNGEAIRFTLTSAKNNTWIFVNKQHDFPQEIIYQFKAKDSLIASVQGNQNGEFRKLEFRLKRSK